MEWVELSWKKYNKKGGSPYNNFDRLKLDKVCIFYTYERAFIMILSLKREREKKNGGINVSVNW